MVSNPANPQSFNRYSYCLNNPLKYIDPSGHQDKRPEITIRPISYGDQILYLCCNSLGGWRIANDLGSLGQAVNSYYMYSKAASMRVVIYDGSQHISDISNTLFATIQRVTRQGTSNQGDAYLNIESRSGANIEADAKYRYVWAQLDTFGPRWTLSESLIGEYGYFYNSWLGKPAIWAPVDLLYELRVSVAGFANFAADAIEFVSPGISMIPPQDMLLLAGAANIFGPEAAGAVLLAYLVAHQGPNALRWLSDQIEP